MRVLIVGSTYPPHNNGQSVFTGSLAEGLVRMGHQVQVLTPGTGALVQRTQRNGVAKISTQALHLGSIHPGLYLASNYRPQVSEIFRSFRPDVVHLQDSAPLSQCVLRAAHREGIPVVATHHIGPEVGAPLLTEMAEPLKDWIEFFIWRWLLAYLNRLDMVVTPSAAAAKMLLGRGLKAPVCSISCGVNRQDFSQAPAGDLAELRRGYGLPAERKIFLYVGRLDYEKRVDVILKAAARLRRDDIFLALAGKGARYDALKRLAKDLQIEDRVAFLGEVAHGEIPALMSCANVFVMPGEAESLSIATLEAMACGKPVLACNAMALPELVSEGVNGFLFEPGNADDAARKMELMALQAESWPQMGAAGRQRVAFHDAGNVLRAYQALYRRVVAGAQMAAKAPKLLPWRLFRLAWSLQLALLFIILALSVLVFYDHSNAAPLSVAHLKDSELYARIAGWKW